MAERTGIEWTDATWNPIRGCSRVSEGCRNCYAERQAMRQGGPGGAYDGLVKSTPSGPRWTGVVRFVPELLDAPLRWTKPRRIFVNSMSDLFHERVEAEWVWLIYGTMAAARQHTFQVLTKRPERMCQLVSEITGHKAPCPNVWLGVSVEDQATADERIPVLLRTPAAVRWVSYEPSLAAVDFRRFVAQGSAVETRGVNWVVSGGESGPGARPNDLAWHRATRDQCASAGVAYFCKQLGARPLISLAEGQAHLYDHPPAYPEYRVHSLEPDGRVQHYALTLRDRKGADMAEWPADLRVREFPR